MYSKTIYRFKSVDGFFICPINLVVWMPPLQDGCIGSIPISGTWNLIYKTGVWCNGSIRALEAWGDVQIVHFRAHGATHG